MSIAHLRVRQDTGARIGVLILALATTATTFAVFASTTLAEEPATMTALVAIIVLAIGLDLTWKWIAHRREGDGRRDVDDSGAEAPGPQMVDARPGG